jgi:predicted outer membrane repeat protein
MAGGGISVSSSGTVNLNGGIISGNTASIGSGGGICVTMSGAYGSSGNGTVTMNGGIISGNTASGYGGGIYVFDGTFKKLPPAGGGQNSGIIYGSDAVGNDANGVPLRNTASSDDDGHAFYFSSTQKRNTTANQTDQIDTSTGRGLSANGNAPFGN